MQGDNDNFKLEKFLLPLLSALAGNSNVHLPGGPALQSLDVRNNRIEDEGVIAFSEAMVTNRCVLSPPRFVLFALVFFSLLGVSIEITITEKKSYNPTIELQNTYTAILTHTLTTKPRI